MNSGMKVWIIDSNEIDLYIFSKTMFNIGFQGDIENFSEIQRACDQLDHIMDIRHYPDIIFLETDFQQDMAFYFLEKLNRRRSIINSSCRVVILAAYVDERLKRILKNFDFVDHVWTKPITEVKLGQIQIFNSAFINEFSSTKER